MEQNPYPETTRRLTKWESVLNRVLADIANDRFSPGDRFHTVTELGREYGVSKITAQRVFRELVDRRIISTHRSAGSFVTEMAPVKTVYLCLRDDHFSDSGRLDRFRAVDAFLDGVRSWSNGLFAKVEPVGLKFLRTHIGEFTDQPILISANAFLDVRDTGVRVNRPLLKELRERLDPIAFHGFCRWPGLSQVRTDLYGGMRKIVDHLARRHTRFACLMGNPNNPWFRPRLRAYVDALLDHDFVFDPEKLKITDGEDREEDFRALDSIMSGPARPTALVCASDSRALHALEYCQRKGISVPEELAVTGFDNLPESAMSRPALTTLDGRNRESGLVAAELLRKRRNGTLRSPTQRLVERALVVRESA